MKILITGKPRAGAVPPTPEQAAMISELQYQWIKEQMATGAVEAFYNVVPSGGIAVVNAESPAAVMEALARFPAAQHLEWDVQMLIDLEETHRLAQIRAEQTRT